MTLHCCPTQKNLKFIEPKFSEPGQGKYSRSSSALKII